jgi:glycosyltransferase involved in cell wall biosynthesis
MILLITASFPPEPIVAASMTLDLARALAGKEKVVILAPPPSRPLGFKFEEKNPPELVFDKIILKSFVYPKSNLFGRAYENYSFGRLSTDFIKENHSGIKCCYVNTWPIISQYMNIRALMKYSIPSVTHVQDIYPESLSTRFPLSISAFYNALMNVDKYILKNSTRVIANSNFMKQVFTENRGIDGNKIGVVQNWGNRRDFREYGSTIVNKKMNGSGKTSFTFMFMGNIGPVAGVDFLISCYDKSRITAANLVIAGCGSEKGKCQKLAGSLKNKDIRFLDVPAGKDYEAQMEADVMLLPVKKGAGMSSVPSKLQSYMFSGKPVIACVDEKSETAYTIKTSRCGWVIPPENQDILISTLKHVSSQPASCLNELGINGLKYATEHFSRDMNLEKLVSVITGIMRK